MENVVIPVQSRTDTDSARSIRHANMIPAVVYAAGFDNQHLKMDYQTFRRGFEKATFSTIINLEVEGGQTLEVLAHDVQYHPVSDNILHVDFYKVDMKKKVTTHVNIVFTGASQAVKEGAVLNTSKHELQISCLPGDLIHQVEVDLSALVKVGDSIHISDISLSDKIEVLDNPEDTVVNAAEPRVAEEEENEAVDAAETAEAAAEETDEKTDEKKEE